MSDQEWATWCVKDSLKGVGQVLAIYAILLSAYWGLVA